jgi:hypothetical protein
MMFGQFLSQFLYICVMYASSFNDVPLVRPVHLCRPSTTSSASIPPSVATGGQHFCWKRWQEMMPSACRLSLSCHLTLDYAHFGVLAAKE